MEKLRGTYKGEAYHICNKSIANYQIFSRPANSKRFLYSLDFYNSINLSSKLSEALRQKKYRLNNLLLPKNGALVKFIAYIIMPDHYHILIKALQDRVISKYISNVENSYTRFFNLKNNRKGPLWQSRFKLIRMKSDEQLLHVSRYIHLNPTTAGLVDKSEDWKFSSYNQYINNSNILRKIMKEITINDPEKYKSFCENRIDYQKKLKKIKKLLLE